MEKLFYPREKKLQEETKKREESFEKKIENKAPQKDFTNKSKK